MPDVPENQNQQQSGVVVAASEPVPVGQASQVQDDEILNALVSNNILTQQKLDELRDEAETHNRPLLAYIEEKRLVREEDLVQIRAKILNVPYIDLFGRIVRGDILNIISQELAQNYRMVAFNQVQNEVSIAMVDPTDFKALEAIEFIARKNRFRMKYYMVSISGLKYILRQYESLSLEVEEALKSAEAEVKLEAGKQIANEGEDVEEVVRRAPVSKMVSVILRHAVEGRASDVHIEPVGSETRVRYRVDGVLHTSIVLPKYIHSSIIARIKVLSNLKIDETRVPQDGRFRMTIENRDIDYRVSTLPLFNQEKVVMRILDTAGGTLGLDQLGFEGRNLVAISDAIKRPHGMILMTGPTGSGKSTTLYAMLSILNSEQVNIVTLEDPIEYYLKGINQSQINAEAGFTFAGGLRSILRQDPDIIMVGEIRDRETAELAIHAALTGHLMLSTLHTNDSFGAVPRLVDMGIEPFLLAASLNVVMAQRLVRRVCQHCRTELTLPEKLDAEVRAGIEELPADVKPKGMDMKKKLTFYRGRGCVRCENSGYKGRIAIIEVFEITPEIQKIIVEGGDMIAKIHQAASKQQMYTMKQDGTLKALRGLTTIEEVLSVTRE
ncbi:MAG: GspE/PulE family protein [bacterium]